MGLRGLPFVPAFPNYSGPFAVGSFQSEHPISELSSPAPEPDTRVTTISFRVFYPCETPSKSSKHHGAVHWISDPQREQVSAFARFLGASGTLSSVLSYLPNLLYYVKIPVLKEAPLLVSQHEAVVRWPVAVFSHGLGGSQNSYSHICGLLSSYGVIVVAPEHRDGSGPISMIRGPDGRTIPDQSVHYRSISHSVNEEVHDARNDQLRIRLWELGLVHDCLEKLEAGTALTNHASDNAGEQDNMCRAMFSNRLDLRPGRISWIGHSFGAVTVAQFLKSVFYRPSKSTPKSYQPIYVPRDGSSLIKQVTDSSVLVLLDPWGLPLTNPKTQWLNKKPLPGHMRSNAPGRNIIAILSEAFFKWNANLQTIKKLLAEDPTQPQRNSTSGNGAYMFYPTKAAHLSQSDFGILFPTLTRLAAKTEEPERILKLNVRAILQVMRLNDIHVAHTSDVDVEMTNRTNGLEEAMENRHDEILSSNGSVRGWVSIGLGDESHEKKRSDEPSLGTEPMEAAVEGKM